MFVGRYSVPLPMPESSDSAHGAAHMEGVGSRDEEGLVIRKSWQAGHGAQPRQCPRNPNVGLLPFIGVSWMEPNATAARLAFL